MSNVHDTGCTLKWEEPKDDGGLPIKEYEVEKMDLATGKWIRCGKVSCDHFLSFSLDGQVHKKKVWKSMLLKGYGITLFIYIFILFIIMSNRILPELLDLRVFIFSYHFYA